jgi:hypothetical protein
VKKIQVHVLNVKLDFSYMNLNVYKFALLVNILTKNPKPAKFVTPDVLNVGDLTKIIVKNVIPPSDSQETHAGKNVMMDN